VGPHSRAVFAREWAKSKRAHFGVAQISELLFISCQKPGTQSSGLRLNSRQDLEKWNTAKIQMLIANG
jgi:hypothetical protein